MRKKSILTILLIIMSCVPMFLLSCRKPNVSPNIDNIISLINDNNGQIYFYKQIGDGFDKINTKNTFEKLEDINYSNSYFTMIVYDCNKFYDTIAQIVNPLLALLNDSYKILIAFVDSKDYDFLDGTVQDNEKDWYPRGSEFVSTYDNFMGETNSNNYLYSVKEENLLFSINVINAFSSRISDYNKAQ